MTNHEVAMRLRTALDTIPFPFITPLPGAQHVSISAIRQALSFHVMTANQLEPVTPRLQPTYPITTTRTWRRPKIRLHNAAPSPPHSAIQSLNSASFRSTRIRVTEPSLLETTPVTNSTTPKPLRFRISGTELQTDNVCRQLFPTPRPPKRPRNATPSFRFSCGRERTQPSSESNGRGQYSDALLASVTQAHRNARIFRNAVTASTEDTTLEAAIGEGLLLEPFDRKNDFLLLRSSSHPHGDQTVDVALVMTDELVPKLVTDGPRRDLSRFLIYIPYPWHAQVVNGFALSSSRILIAGHTADVFRKEHILSHEGLSKLTLLALLPFIEQTNNVRPCDSGPPHVSDTLFATVSPHSAVTNLSVYVDFYDSDHHVAIIRDDAGEFAVLLTNNNEIRPRSDKYELSDVSVLPYHLLPRVMVDIAGKDGNEDFQKSLEHCRSKISCWIFQY